MKVETKFNVGDNVYTMYSNRIALFVVESIQVYIGKGDTYPSIKYTLSYFDEKTNKDENEVFATREGIIKFLKENLY